MKAILETQELILIEPAKWAAQIKSVAESIIPAHGFENEDGLPCDLYGDPLQMMQVDEDGLAVVPVHGVISSGLPSVAACFGFVDTARIQDDIASALSNSRVRAIVLDFDSPGGFVTGTPELANYIAEVGNKLPIYSFTSGLCCSAAYWLAASTRAILATPSAEVGSIGVYVAHQDTSALAKAMGLVVSVFRSGKYKGAGVPGTSLSEDQAANIQSRVDSLASLFKSAVLSHRPGIAEETMQGQTFMGYQSAGVKLTDGLVNNYEDAKKIILGDLT